MRQHIMRGVLVVVLGLGLVTPVLAEPIRMTDSRGWEWMQDGPITCVQISPTFGTCGRTQLPPDPGAKMTMRPITHDCSRQSPTDSWSCQPRGGGGLTAEQRALLLQQLRQMGPVETPGQAYARALAAGACMAQRGVFDPVTSYCQLPPAPPPPPAPQLYPAPPPPPRPLNCYTSPDGGGGWTTICH